MQARRRWVLAKKQLDTGKAPLEAGEAPLDAGGAPLDASEAPPDAGEPIMATARWATPAALGQMMPSTTSRNTRSMHVASVAAVLSTSASISVGTAIRPPAAYKVTA